MVEDTWCGNVIVADDIALLSVRLTGRQVMFDVVNDYSKRWNLN